MTLAALLIVGAVRVARRPPPPPSWADLVEALGDRMSAITSVESDPTRLEFVLHGRDRRTNAAVRAAVRYCDAYLFGEMEPRLRAVMEATSRAQQRRIWLPIAERAASMGIDEVNAYLSQRVLPEETDLRERLPTADRPTSRLDHP